MLLLRSLPGEIGQLTRLQTLDLSNTPLQSLPGEIGQLTQLQTLDLSDTPLQSLPVEIGQLTQLQTLHLSRTKLQSLPGEIGQLTQLQILDLSRAPLQSLPREIGQLVQLQTLHLSRAPLQSLPREIGQLVQLQTLDLRRTKLQSLPGEIGQLARLQTLDLSNTPLQSLPVEIGQLAQLQILDLSRAPLQSLPREIGQLVQLQTLHLSRTKLQSLPGEIGQLAQLQTLDLSGTKLQSLPGEIGQLARLQTLDLSETELQGLPREIGQLAWLQTLDLSDTPLQSLPGEIGQLAQFQTLDLSNTPLRHLPRELEDLPALRKLFLHGCEGLGLSPELLGPTREEVGMGRAEPASPQAILQHYFRRQQERTRRLNEAKVLIVGQGGVGKTSLVQRLVNKTFDENEAKTEGIEIIPWMIPGREGEEIQLNVWDFGGQEIMHATHQFFLTRRSLYLLVLDARKGENEGNLIYWLRLIQSFGGDSPALVVVNKHEPPNELKLNEHRLRQDHPNIRGFFYVSCRVGGEPIEALEEAIRAQIHTLPHVFDALPLSYFQTRDQLRKLAEQRDYIGMGEYEEICRQNTIPDPGEQANLLRYFHDLGTVLNFHDPQSPYQLREQNIFNPEWVTEGIYRIITNLELARRNGELRLPEMGAILKDPAHYPPTTHRFLLDMMRKFELCFEYPSAPRERYLVPELLTPQEPDLDWEADQPLRFEYHYDEVLPSGLIPRFIVRMQHHLTDRPTCWRSGVVLRIDGNRALVRGDVHKKRIFIAVQGPPGGRRSALGVIRSDFQAIHCTIPNLLVRQKVPLPDLPDVSVDYDYLRKLEGLGQREFVPENLPDGVIRSYVVRELLDGIEEVRRRYGDDRGPPHHLRDKIERGAWREDPDIDALPKAPAPVVAAPPADPPALPPPPAESARVAAMEAVLRSQAAKHAESVMFSVLPILGIGLGGLIAVAFTFWDQFEPLAYSFSVIIAVVSVIPRLFSVHIPPVQHWMHWLEERRWRQLHEEAGLAPPPLPLPPPE